MLFELTPEFDSRKSFHQKAYVRFPVLSNGYPDPVKTSRELLSYGTHVMTIDPEARTVELRPRWDESATTLRHVKELLKQNGFTAESKAQIARDYA